MKKETFIHFLILIIFFLLIVLAHGWLNSFSYTSILLFIIGGVLGVIVPDIDHLIYVYFLKPQELTSQRIARMGTDIKNVGQLLVATKTERTGLIFHTIFFQVIFLVLAFFVLTSSSSLFGKGLVLAFSMHLLVDETLDLAKGSINNWFRGLPMSLDSFQQKVFLIIMFLLLLAFGVII